MTSYSRPQFAAHPADLGEGGRGARRTFDVGASAPVHRRRFARDGDVEVVVRRGRSDAGLESDRSAIQAERDAREQAERSLAAAQATIRDLQTKLAHAEMALTEIREAAQRAEQRAQQLEALEFGRTTTKAKKAAAAEPVARKPARAPQEVAHTERRNTSAVNVLSGRVVTKFAERQQPVDWWSKPQRK